jgi:hypothetical protein
MRNETYPRLLPTLSPALPELPALPRTLWEALITAPNWALSGESRALR